MNPKYIKKVRKIQKKFFYGRLVHQSKVLPNTKKRFVAKNCCGENHLNVGTGEWLFSLRSLVPSVSIKHIERNHFRVTILLSTQAACLDIGNRQSQASFSFFFVFSKIIYGKNCRLQRLSNSDLWMIEIFVVLERTSENYVIHKC